MAWEFTLACRKGRAAASPERQKGGGKQGAVLTVPEAQGQERKEKQEEGPNEIHFLNIEN